MLLSASVLLTVPAELRQHFNGSKQLKRSTGTSDLRDAKRRQHSIATELYSQLDARKPDIRDVISDLLGWISDDGEVQRMDDEGHLEGLIQQNKNLSSMAKTTPRQTWSVSKAQRLSSYTGSGRPRL
jgi:hypothetical protein